MLVNKDNKSFDIDSGLQIQKSGQAIYFVKDKHQPMEK